MDGAVGERAEYGVDPDLLSGKDSISGPVASGLSITNAKRAIPSGFWSGPKGFKRGFIVRANSSGLVDKGHFVLSPKREFVQ